jgi:uncharacterized protein YoaH (UPF0181 family)
MFNHGGHAMAESDLELIRGTFDLLILKTLAWGPMHGLGVLRWIETVTEQRLLIEEGALYPALHRLEQRGWVSAEWGYSESNRKGEVLPPDAARPSPAGDGTVEMGALHRSSRHGHHGRRRCPMSSDRQRHRGVNLPPSKGRIDSALHEEFQFHLEERIEQFMATGMTRAQAEAEVRRRFGDVDTWHRMAREIDEETMRQNRRFELFDTLRRETARAFRVLLRTPTFSLVALFTLALGMGATTAIYTVLDACRASTASLPRLARARVAASPGHGSRQW